jgi:hypothetical protein
MSLLPLFANRAGCWRVAGTDSESVGSTGSAMLLKARERLSAEDLSGNCCLGEALAIFSKRDLGLGEVVSSTRIEHVVNRVLYCATGTEFYISAG